MRAARILVAILAILAIGTSTLLLLRDLISSIPEQDQGDLPRIVFGTNWKAQAEHGGYYQALAKGIYDEYGLNVEIRQGGPQVNHSLLMAAGKIDFNMGGGLYGSLNYVESGIPVITIASMFQKDPQVLITHRSAGIDSLADMVGHPMLIGNDARLSFWRLLKLAYGFKDEQLRPYTFNSAPFLADETAIQQGYVTSEPYAIAQAGGDPKVFLLADYGITAYSTLLETSRQLIEDDPDLVQRFVDASILGWHSYLYDDPTPANELIMSENPDITPDQLAFSRDAMIEHGIVDSGDSLIMGIGAMTDVRWQAFFDQVVEAGIYQADLDFRKAYSLQFVNRGLGLDHSN